MSEAPSVILYSRRACGLCDEARATILAERDRRDFRFREVLIDGDDELERCHGMRVPVVEVNGVEVFEYMVDAAGLRSLLA